MTTVWAKWELPCEHSVTYDHHTVIQVLQHYDFYVFLYYVNVELAHSVQVSHNVEHC